jgi:hypothetical protein
LKDELARKLETLGLDGRHTPRVIEHKHQVEGLPVGALGRTRWLRRPVRAARAAVEAVGAVRAQRTGLGAGAAIVAIAIEGVRWISNARVRAECCLKRAVVRLTARGDVLAERDFALGARAQCGMNAAHASAMPTTVPAPCPATRDHASAVLVRSTLHMASVSAGFRCVSMRRFTK